MTMRIEIKNTDQSRTLRVKVRDSQGPGHVIAQTVEVQPLGSTDVWIHSGRDAVLEEVQS